MKMVKSAFLASAAGLVAMSGAQAADLPVKAKPVEHVKVCSLYGAGFYYIPGPDICMKAGGYIRYQVTAIGAPGPNLYVAQEIEGNQFKIAGGKPGGKVSWQVTGIRQDPYAKVHPIRVEEEKPLGEMGHYLHPDAYQAVGTFTQDAV